MKNILIIFGLLLSACTYTISMAHTEGSASDVIDDTPEANGTLTVPISGTSL
jgi:hypothetical protein